jgi:hypothetical protein
MDPKISTTLLVLASQYRSKNQGSTTFLCVCVWGKLLVRQFVSNLVSNLISLVRQFISILVAI